GIVSAAGANITHKVMSTPHDHLAAGPHCRVKFSASGGIGGAGSCPTICAGIVSAPSVQPVTNTIIKISAPKDHFTAGPDYRVIDSRRRRVGGAGACPTVGGGIIFAAGVQIAAAPQSAPDDHFTAGPDCGVSVSAKGLVGGAGGCPAVGVRILSPAGVKTAATISAPHDHFTAGPDCRVKLSAVWRADNVRWSPCVIGARIRVG